jgi:hypothetical protein
MPAAVPSFPIDEILRNSRLKLGAAYKPVRHEPNLRQGVPSSTCFTQLLSKVFLSERHRNGNNIPILETDGRMPRLFLDDDLDRLHTHGAGTTGAQERENDDGLHPRPQQGWPRGAQPTRQGGVTFPSQPFLFCDASFPRRFMTCCMSSHTSRFMLALRRRNAG